MLHAMQNKPRSASLAPGKLHAWLGAGPTVCPAHVHGRKIGTSCFLLVEFQGEPLPNKKKRTKHLGSRGTPNKPPAPSDEARFRWPDAPTENPFGSLLGGVDFASHSSAWFVRLPDGRFPPQRNGETHVAPIRCDRHKGGTVK